MEQDRNTPIALFLGDVVRLRKPHPCGSHDWTVVRLGADIGLICTGCGRRVLLPRREVQRRTRQFVSRGPGFAEAVRLIAEQDRSVEADGDRESRPGPSADDEVPTRAG